MDPAQEVPTSPYSTCSAQGSHAPPETSSTDSRGRITVATATKISNTEQPLTKRKVSPRFVSKFSVQTFVDKDAELGIGVRVGHFATVHSNVKVGNNVRIEDGCRIYEGCEIGDY